MKTSFKLLCFLTVALLTVVQSAEAQRPGLPGGSVFGGGLYEPSQFQPVAGDLNIGVPGRIWLEANYADAGLGYSGSYATLGAKQRLFEDFLDGRWLFEGRAHYSIENEAFFANVGIERIFSIDAANAEVSTSIWYDYDGDTPADDALKYHQVGLSAAYKTKTWDLIGNGYFPVGTTSTGNGPSCFFDHSISLTPLVDSALEGFDAAVRLKPRQLSFVNGTLDIGGYGYSGDNIEFFGGGRVRLGMQVLKGAILSAEVNYDDRFDLTGLVGMGWVFGANPGTGSNYAGIGRDLEQTVRQDHIVRGYQAATLAIDPDTGLPYNVVHVDNSADASVGDGSFATPFTTLADAEANSGTDDIIFVDEGLGTSVGMRDGIVLQDNQLLLGDGVLHLLPLADGTLFELCNDLDGNRPTIAGSNNGAAVTLANNNTVRGFNIDGNEGRGGQAYGIYGDGRVNGAPVNGGIIEDNNISNSILHGVFLSDIEGDWQFARNDINNNGFDGIRIVDACDPTSVFNYIENNVTFNGRDGISMEDYDAQAINFLRNVTSNNIRDGVRLVNFKGTGTRGFDLLFQNHTSIDNSGFGIHIDGGQGDLRFLNPTIQGNARGGIRVVDWFADASLNTDRVIVDGANITGNIAGPGLQFVMNSGVMDLLVTNTTSDGNGAGLQIRTENPGTVVRASVIDNLSFSNNLADGIQAYAISGSTIRLLVDQPTIPLPTRLPITGNGQHGINILAGDNFPIQDAEVFADIRNTSITLNAQAGINAQSILDGFLELDLSDSNIDNNAVGLNLLTTNSQLNPRVVNTIQLDRVTMLDNAFESILFNSGPTTYTDLIVRNSSFAYTTTIDAAGDNNGVRGGGFLSNAFQFNLTGDATTAFVDSRTRFQLLDSNVTGANFDGIEINTSGDHHLLVDLTGNTINLNGFIGDAGDQATGGGEIELPMAGTGFGTFFHGVDLNATGDSRVDLRMTANDIDRNSELGIEMSTGLGSTINALWITNDLSINDTTDDVSTAGREDNNFDWAAINGGGGNMCLAMTNNNDFWGRVIINNSATVDFVLELDGLTNGFGAGAVPGNVTLAPFGSTCEGLIQAEEAAFAIFGFPPTE